MPSRANVAWTERGRAQYIGRPHLSFTITGENQWSTPSYFAAESEKRDAGTINISIEGTFIGLFTLQRSFDDGVTWFDVEQYNTAIEKCIRNLHIGVKWRLGIKAGDYGSGTAYVRMSQV